MSGQYFRLGALASIFLLCISCDSSNQNSSGRFGDDSGRNGSFVSRGASFGGPNGNNPGGIQRGTDNFINALGLSGRSQDQAIVIPADNETVEISLVNASVESASKAVLGDALGLNYVVSDQINGTVTVRTTGPIPKTALLELFEAALSSIGAQLLREGNVVKVLPGTAGNTTFRLASQRAGRGSPILVAPLEYISATEMTRLLAPLTEQGLRVLPDRSRNLLLLSGTGELLEASLDALNLFDVDVLQGKSVALVQLRSADPEAIVGELAQIFEAEEGGMLEGVVEFIPNQRLGSVLIVSSRASYIDKARRWIRELDTTASGASLYLATYNLQNRSAVEVAPILNDLLVTSSRGSEEEVASASNDGPRVAADDGRNALIVRARRSDHRQIESLLRELDSSPRQVLLEATIAEVTLNDELEIGTRWFFQSGNWDFRFSDLSSGSVSPNSPSFAAVFGVGGAELALSALAGVTDVRVISSPTLMVLDNKEGILQIGDQVPVATQTSSSSDAPNAPVLTQIDYRDTGIILRVRPRIGAGGRVTLDISQEVSDVAATRTSGIDSPTIRQRKIQTSVALGDGRTLALGGLVQERDSIARTETPGVARVPVVGNLFRSKEVNRGRVELLILIRPRVVNNENDAAAITSQWRAKLAASNSLLQTGLGSSRHSIRDLVE